MDFFDKNAAGLESPAYRHYTVTPSDEDLPVRPRALYVSGDGTLVLRDEGGVDITYTVAEGDVIPFRAVQVRAASTASCVAWY